MSTTSTVSHAGSRRVLLIAGVALAFALVSLAVQYPILAASRHGFSLTADQFGYATDPAQAFARVLAAATVLAWLVGERVLESAPGGARRGTRLAGAFGLGAAALGAWSFLSYTSNAYLWTPSSWGDRMLPWTGPSVPIYFTNSTVDLGPSIGHPDVDLLLGPGLLLVALGLGLLGALWTAASVGAARAEARAHATSLGAVALVIAAGVAGIVACEFAVLSPDLVSTTPWLEPQLFGALVAIPLALAVSGGRRGSLVLLLLASLALVWNPVVLWAAGESDAYLGLAVLAVALPAIATSWRPAAAALERRWTLPAHAGLPGPVG